MRQKRARELRKIAVQFAQSKDAQVPARTVYRRLKRAYSRKTIQSQAFLDGRST